MATMQLTDNFVNTVIDTPETAYTAAEGSVVIESITVTNNSPVNASYKAYIKNIDKDLIPIKPFKIVVWGKLDLGLGIIGQVIPKGADLIFESSALDSIYFTVSGKQV